MTDFEAAVALTKSLLDIMEREGEQNWIRGVEAMFATLKLANPSDAVSVTGALREASSIYRSMHGGAGTFSNYYVQRNDYAGQKAVNEEFGRVCDDLWKILVAHSLA